MIDHDIKKNKIRKQESKWYFKRMNVLITLLEVGNMPYKYKYMYNT